MTESRTIPAAPEIPPNIDHAHGQPTPMPAGDDIGPLEDWLDTYIEHEEGAVRLPKLGREYHIQRPTEAAREQLFEASRKNPLARPPFWSTIWASGIGLADVALERRDELAGQTVLELGCGMGVTASAVLEAGADLIAVDLSDLALGLCRYNTLTNTGLAPRSLRPCLSRFPRRASGSSSPPMCSTKAPISSRSSTSSSACSLRMACSGSPSLRA